MPGPQTFTPRELDVMAALWALGDASVAEVQARLDDELAYTTVLSVLQLLEHKGHVTHERDGRRYRYRPTTSARDAGGPLLDRLLESLYKHSPVRLVAHLVDRGSVSDAELEQIRRLIDQRLAGSEGEEAP